MRRRYNVIIFIIAIALVIGAIVLLVNNTIKGNDKDGKNTENSTNNLNNINTEYEQNIENIVNPYTEKQEDGQIENNSPEIKEEKRFKDIDTVAEYNQMKVLNAMQKNNTAEMHLHGSTGYGYDDEGRDNLERIYADIFHTEDALVRPQIACGTHALNVALAGNLRPGDELLSPVGKPYDTMDEVIGIRENSSSLKAFGVKYEQIDLINDDFDYQKIKERVEKAIKMQRERYANMDILYNSELTPKLIERYCKLDNVGNKIMEKAFINYGLTARTYTRILKVARTIADLEGNMKITAKNIAEAIQYRFVN